MVILWGCASTTTISRQEYKGGKIARPNHVVIYDFAATPSGVPRGSVFAGHSHHSSPQTSAHIASGRQAGAEIAEELVEDILNMALPVIRASTQIRPQIGDLVIRGYLLSIEEGRAKDIANEISKQLKVKFKEQGWI